MPQHHFDCYALQIYLAYFKLWTKLMIGQDFNSNPVPIQFFNTLFLLFIFTRKKQQQEIKNKQKKTQENKKILFVVKPMNMVDRLLSSLFL